jgi:hypothetical protein
MTNTEIWCSSCPGGLEIDFAVENIGEGSSGWPHPSKFSNIVLNIQTFHPVPSWLGTKLMVPEQFPTNPPSCLVTKMNGTSIHDELGAGLEIPGSPAWKLRGNFS